MTFVTNGAARAKLKNSFVEQVNSNTYRWKIYTADNLQDGQNYSYDNRYKLRSINIYEFSSYISDELGDYSDAVYTKISIDADFEAEVLSTMTELSATVEKPSSWAETDVTAAIAAKLVPQALQSKYTEATTRAEFAALAVTLYETVKGTITERSGFADTTDENVEKAAAIGVVNGVGDNKFDPNAKLAREQAATMLARLAEALGKPLAKQAATFADNDNISLWAFEQVGQMQASGVMGGVGDNAFSPKPITQGSRALLR